MEYATKGFVVETVKNEVGKRIALSIAKIELLDLAEDDVILVGINGETTGILTQVEMNRIGERITDQIKQNRIIVYDAMLIKEIKILKGYRKHLNKVVVKEVLEDGI